MKYIFVICGLLLPIIFSSTSNAKWTKVVESVDGNEFYLDFERIRKHSGYIYIWRVDNYLKPDPDGTLSEKLYIEVDCKLFRSKYLSATFHSQPMGKGTPQDIAVTNLNEWQYPSPGSVLEIILEETCDR